MAQSEKLSQNFIDRLQLALFDYKKDLASGKIKTRLDSSEERLEDLVNIHQIKKSKTVENRWFVWSPIQNKNIMGDRVLDSHWHPVKHAGWGGFDTKEELDQMFRKSDFEKNHVHWEDSVDFVRHIYEITWNKQTLQFHWLQF